DHLIVRATAWFLRSRRLTEDMASTIAYFSQGVEALARQLPDVLDAAGRAKRQSLVAKYQGSGAPESTALRVASLDALFAALDIGEVASGAPQTVQHVAGGCFDPPPLAPQLGLPELREQISALPADQHWLALARNAMLDDLASLQRTITGEALNGFDESVPPDALVSAWQARNQRAIERTQQLLAELKN